jgi:DNA primase
MTPEQKMQMQKVDNRRNLLETVATYCHNLLLSESKKAIAYLTDERGFTALDIEDLGLGIFPSADRAAAHLLQVFSIEDLEENGILYRIVMSMAHQRVATMPRLKAISRSLGQTKTADRSQSTVATTPKRRPKASPKQLLCATLEPATRCGCALSDRPSTSIGRWQTIIAIW